MKHFLLLPILLFFTAPIKAQSVYVNLTNGHTEVFSLSSVQKITFSGQNMNLIETNGIVNQWNINTIKNYSYTEITSVQEPTFDSHSSFPNPFIDQLSITYSVKKSGSTNILIYDIIGNIVYDEKVVSSIGENQIEIGNLQYLPKGIYYCSIALDNEFIDIKLIKQ